MPGVTRVQSRSIRGGQRDEHHVRADDRHDLRAAAGAGARESDARATLPAGLDIEVERLTPSLFPILSYNLEGGDPATLYDIARYQIKPLISRVPGVGRVDVQGSDVREIEVIADPARLAAQQMTYRRSGGGDSGVDDGRRGRPHAAGLPAVSHRDDDRGALDGRHREHRRRARAARRRPGDGARRDRGPRAHHRRRRKARRR